ncbi:MAG: sulfite exporter TauE/SafE family protein [Chloroflexi bacterium]|nr:sulfite exporter TauE/SafE family protein [Chloroflexota bacterium]
MDVAVLMLVGGVGAGIFGSLLGLGGGLLIVPLLTLGFHLPLREAIGVSLVCVIVTSGASAGIFLERRVANLRLGMTLELFTATGALLGGLIAFLLDERVLAGLFSALLIYVAVSMIRPRTAVASPDADARLDGESLERATFMDRLSGPGYRVHRLRAGIVGSVGAGVASALLGIGGGLIKVPVLHVVMGVPLRVATATSNLVIGITASTSAWIYLIRGGIDPYAAGPTAVGVFVGASIGSRIAHRVDLRALRVLFTVVLLYTAFQMLRRAAGVQ